MVSINRTLKDNDPALLPVLAAVWEVKAGDLSHNETVDRLTEAMLTPEKADKVWAKLDDPQRGALQTLLSLGGKMPMAKFERLFGVIRQMGAAGIERERPHENPATVAEALFYRGLVAQAFEHGETGARAIVYIPDEFKDVLPTHKTAYEKLESPPAEAPAGVKPIADVTNIQQANTSIVDDLTTLLASLQLNAAAVTDDSDIQLAPADRDALSPHLLIADANRTAFLFSTGLSLDLIDIQGGRAYPKRAEARRWLSASRGTQIRQLAEAWQTSDFYRDLWHVPGLFPDNIDGYDPTIARDAVIALLGDLVPTSEWWSLDAFIASVKETEPDFQRPDGVYDSWYIRNAAEEFLTGFESWDAVEGALLEFYLLGPMHWLGLVDLADEAVRLTAYGRSFLGTAPWRDQPDAEEKAALQPDGVVLISRRASRIDRFQLARFTTWGRPAGLNDNRPYSYALDEKGLRRAAEQGIHAEHITSFLTRVTGIDKLPQSVSELLTGARSGPTGTVSLERLIVLRTTSSDMMDFVLATPSLRRYLGARLGPMAVVVQESELDALLEALNERGIIAEILST